MSAKDGEPRPGDVVGGKYRIESLIGRGGMGGVFAARHEQLGHRVALKLPAPSGSPGTVARFLREARAAAAIESEHVARVFDAGERAPGAPYLVMELLTGADLAALLRERGAVGQEEAVTWILQAGAGLAAAHARGIVHRDLKPANLFLARRPDGTALVKLLDFGISKLRAVDGADGAGEDVTLTRTGHAVGSPRYMSPEQMEGSPDVDERADLWALGAILHELLGGAPAFGGRSFDELRRRILSAPPPSLRLSRPELSADLEAVILRCLDRAPARRFASVADLLDALVPFGPPDAARYAARARSELSHRAATPTPPGAATTAVERATEPAAAPPAAGHEPPPAGATETSPPLSQPRGLQAGERPAIPRPRRRALAAAAALALGLAAALGAAAARWWAGTPAGAAASSTPSAAVPGAAVAADAELARAAHLRAVGDRAAAKRALQGLVDVALAEGVAPGSPRAAVVATAVLGLADMAAEELAAPPPALSLETYQEPAATLARQTQDGMRLYGAVIPWQDAAVMQCALVGQARLHERQSALLLGLAAPPPRTGPHQRGAWSPEAALEAYRSAADSALEVALDLYDNAAARPVPTGRGCREEAARGRARLLSRPGK